MALDLRQDAHEPLTNARRRPLVKRQLLVKAPEPKLPPIIALAVQERHGAIDETHVIVDGFERPLKTGDIEGGAQTRLPLVKRREQVRVRRSQRGRQRVDHLVVLPRHQVTKEALGLDVVVKEEHERARSRTASCRLFRRCFRPLPHRLHKVLGHLVGQRLARPPATAEAEGRVHVQSSGAHAREVAVEGTVQ